MIPEQKCRGKENGEGKNRPVKPVCFFYMLSRQLDK